MQRIRPTVFYNGDPAWNEMAATNLSVTNQYAQEAWTSFYTGVKKL